jgi:hypothetical protein
MSVHQRKSFAASEVKFDRDGAQGEFLAEFAKLNVVDKDGDVLLPGLLGGAAGSGDGPFKVRIASWGHKWQELPVGIGDVYEQDGALYCAGKFFLDTASGLETYKTVKALGPLAEWSFGFDIEAAEPGQYDGRQVRFLKGVRVFEVSPVLQGAGIGTHTVDMKGAGCPTCGAAAKEPAQPGADENDAGECEECGKVLVECACDHMHGSDEGEGKQATADVVVSFEVTRARLLGVPID